MPATIAPPPTPAPAPAIAPAGPTFVFTGHGFGHGIGLSQYGAEGYAEHGTTYDQILAHFYPGTTLGSTPAAQVRILLAEGRKTLTVSSDAPFSVTDGSGVSHPLQPGSYAFGPGLRLRLDPAAPAQPLPGPLVFSPSSAPLRLKHPYRGLLSVSSDGRRLRVIDTVGLEGYLYGVVTSEMPSYWSPEALKAQAVAARSYALAHGKPTGDFDLFADTRSQVYGGIDAETPESVAAVDATGGQVLLYNGQVADTLFSSSSGGRTAALVDVWPTAKPVPYLVSVDDPFDTISPYHDWGPLAISAAEVAKALKLPGTLLDLQTTGSASGRVDQVIAVGSLAEVLFSGTDLRRALRLRSTWFDVGLLAIDPPPPPVVYGSQVRLTGIARGVSGVSLEQRPTLSTWQPVGQVVPEQDGTFATVVSPLVTTYYRLTAGLLAGATIRVPVAPLLRFYPVTGDASLSGTERPVFPGATVEIERQDGTAWTTVATAVVDDKGDFEADFVVSPGAYRAVLAPGHGLVPGMTPALQVSPP